MKEIIKENNIKIPEDRILYNEPLSKHTSFRIGGNANKFIICNDEKELSYLLSVFKEKNEKHMLIGNGSNLLFSDEGYDGVIVKLGGIFEEISVDGNKIHVGGAKLLSGTSSFACENSLTGMEFASGIPGSIGGAVYMNAGAYGSEMKNIIEKVRVMSPDGQNIKEISCNSLDMSYRNSVLQKTGDIVLDVTLKLEKGNKIEISARISELSQKRNSKQPINFPSAGSTFKRPTNGYAAALIDQSGLKGLSVGGAQVSEKHSGFVINKGGATCNDVLTLMKKVRKKVYEDSGIILEPEIRIIGEKFE